MFNSTQKLIDKQTTDGYNSDNNNWQPANEAANVRSTGVRQKRSINKFGEAVVCSYHPGRPKHEENTLRPADSPDSADPFNGVSQRWNTTDVGISFPFAFWAFAHRDF